MEVREFEKAILEKGLKPLQVFFRKGRQVRWFVCKENTLSLILFDKDGQAWKIRTKEPVSEETIFNIQYYDSDSTIRVNGNTLTRCAKYDLFNDTQRDNQ